MFHPLAHFNVRPDLALELGLLEIARRPMAELKFRTLMTKHGTRRGGVLNQIWPTYPAYCAAIAKYPLPREAALFCQIAKGEKSARAVISDGLHHFYIPFEGLFASVMSDAFRALEQTHPEMLLGEAWAGDPLRPAPLEAPARELVAPDCFVVVGDGCRRAAIMPRSMWRDFSDSRPFLTILHPDDLDIASA